MDSILTFARVSGYYMRIIMKKERHVPQGGDLPVELAAPARRALAGAGISRLEQLTRLSEAEISRLHGIGPNAIKQLRQALRAKGLAFGSGKARG